MLRPVLAAVSLAAFAGVHLETDYSIERTLVIESDSSLKMETTTMEMERDGEPVDRAGGGGGGSSEQSHRWITHDKVLAHDGTRPTKVRRAFQEVGGKRSMSFGDEDHTSDVESPLKGVTLEIESGDGDKTVAKVVDGDAPSDHAALEGHALTLAVDALLPEKDVDAGGSWDLDASQIKRALGLDVEHALFPPPAPEEEGGGGGGDGGGRGRGRGPRYGGGGADLLSRAEWEGKATLTDETEDQGGVACQVIRIALKAEGDLPEPAQGERGGRRGGRVSIDPEAIELATAFESKYEIKLEGKLYFSRAEKRPVLLELEGTARTESHTERTVRDSTMKFHSVRSGAIKYRVAVSKAE